MESYGESLPMAFAGFTSIARGLGLFDGPVGVDQRHQYARWAT
jgi:hypothetical protein